MLLEKGKAHNFTQLADCVLGSSLTFILFFTFGHNIWYIQFNLPDIWFEKQSVNFNQLI